MKGHTTRSQGLKGITNVDLGATGNAQMEVWQGKFDKMLQEIEDLLSR